MGFPAPRNSVVQLTGNPTVDLKRSHEACRAVMRGSLAKRIAGIRAQYPEGSRATIRPNSDISGATGCDRANNTVPVRKRLRRAPPRCKARHSGNGDIRILIAGMRIEIGHWVTDFAMQFEVRLSKEETLTRALQTAIADKIAAVALPEALDAWPTNLFGHEN